MELSLLAQGLLVGIAFCAGLISSIAGSGGLLTLPALLWCGLPPMTALATNKVQSALGTVTSTFNFFRNGHLNVRSMLPSVTMGIVGSIIGTFTVQAINGAILTKLMPLLLLAISLYFLFSIFAQGYRLRSTAFDNIRMVCGYCGIKYGHLRRFFRPRNGLHYALLTRLVAWP